jgi:RsiW-degrading membrane proteinase PrsW (M82 family)
MTAAVRNDPERGRRIAGAVLYILLMLIGAGILVEYFILEPLAAPHVELRFQAMAIGAVLAFPPLLIYLWVPWIVDRFDPEPWWSLALALLWGAVAACGFSAFINSNIEELVVEAAGGPKNQAALAIGEVVGACFSAPLVEEFWKGLAILGAFFFLRREFDGVVDGIIYATFAALGFAATENVVYYSRAGFEEALKHKDGILASTFLVRGILAPWGHPLYTSMTGIGFGIARETHRTWLRWLAPIGGYFAAVFLHFAWNAAATYSNQLLLWMLPLWLLFVLSFFGMVTWLVVRKGRIIRDCLRDEILLGNLTQEELGLVTSPIGRLRATFTHGGAAGRKFVAAAARLGLCKWHAARAMRGQKRTISMDRIVPLRQELFGLRQQMIAKTGRGAVAPPRWQPPPPGWGGPPGGGYSGGGHSGQMPPGGRGPR